MRQYKIMNNIKKTTFFMFATLFFLLFFSITSLAAENNSSLSYNTVFEIKTDNADSWHAGIGTACSLNNTLNLNKNVIIAAPAGAGGNAITFYNNIGDSWSEKELKNTEDIAFSFNLYIKELSALQDENGNILGGTIGFIGEKIMFTWKVKDLALKRGWNYLLLNFRTAETSFVDDTTLSLFNTTEELYAKPATSAADGDTSKNVKKKETQNIEDYSYFDTNNVFVTINKVPENAETFIGISDAKIVNFKYIKDNKAVASNKKNYGKQDILIAVIVTALIIIVIVIITFLPNLKRKKKK